MMQAMKGATMALGSMNKSMNLPQLQRIAMEFERENDIMEQRQEMMDDAVDDAMDVGIEEEGDEVVDQVLEEIGIDFSQAVRNPVPSSMPLLDADELADGRDTYGTWEPCRLRRKDCSSCWRGRRRRRSCGRRSSSSVGQPEEVMWLVCSSMCFRHNSRQPRWHVDAAGLVYCVDSRFGGQC
jgi:charged multivesicular body protein 2A